VTAGGMGGRDSSSEVPNDEDGLKGLIPPKPVDCGFNMVGDDEIVDGAENTDVVPSALVFEGGIDGLDNVFPAVIGVVVLRNDSWFVGLESVLVLAEPGAVVGALNANKEATLLMFDPVPTGLKLPELAFSAPTCWGALAVFIIAISIIVGGFGTGGTSGTGVLYGFRDPV